MRKINRKKEPDFWTDYKKLHPKEQYRDLEKTAAGNEVRQSLRKYLIASQNGLCAYCCRQIGLNDSLNEHIRPQEFYQNETMDYDNLIASCKTEGVVRTCASKKDNAYDEKLFVSPLEEKCEEKFVFSQMERLKGLKRMGDILAVS